MLLSRPGSYRMYIRVLSVIIFFLGFLSFLENVLGITSVLDTLLVPADSPDAVLRMSLISSINASATGIVLFIIAWENVKKWYTLIGLTVVVLTNSLMGFFIYLLGLNEFFDSIVFTNTSPSGLLVFILISAGLIMFIHAAQRFEFRVEHKLLMGLISSAVIILFVSISSSQRLSNLRETQSHLYNTLYVKRCISEVFSFLLDMQTAVGTRAGTSKDNFSDYAYSKDKFDTKLRILDSAFTREENSRHKVNEVGRLVESRFPDLLNSAKEGMGDGLIREIGIYQTPVGMQQVDSIRTLLAQLDSDLDRSLVLESEYELTDAGKTRFIIGVNIVLQMMLLASIFWMVVGYVKIRRSHIQEIRKTNAGLEEKVAERTLSIEKSETRFRTTLESMLEGCQIIGHDWRYIYINDSAERHNRRPKWEMMGKRYQNVWPGIEETAVYDLIRCGLEERKTATIENEFIYPDGSKGWFELSIQPVPEGVFILSVDISGRKQAEAAREETEERMRILVEEATEAIFLHDEQGKLVEVNEIACKVLGYTRDELLSMSLMDLVVGTSFEAAKEGWSRVKPGEGRTFQSIHRRKDGSVFPVELRQGLITVRGKRMIYAFVRDITERLQAEHELRESEKMYKNLFENNPQPMWIYDLDNLNFLEVNEAAINSYGYSRREFLNMNLKNIRPEEDVSDLLQNVKNTVSGITKSGPWRHRRKDGSIIFVEIISHELFYRGRKARLVLADDITEKKYASDELQRMNESLEQIIRQRTEQLDAANRAKSDFLSSMSHEMRTPMNAILGYSELLGRRVDDQTSLSFIQSIRASGRTLLHLINDILDLSKIEAGKMELDLVNINPGLFFREFENVFSFKVSEKKLRFISEIDHRLPACLKADESRLRQILLNLLGNAVKYTDHGEVRLKVRCQNDRDSVEPGSIVPDTIGLRIEVSDTGPGIPEESLEEIFDYFVQVRGSRKKEGTGLGLAITKSLVNLMGGTIKVESILGKGTTFIVVIPDLEVTPPTKVEMREEFDPGSIVFEKAVILVVDDVTSNRNYIKEALAHTNIEVLEATGGSEALTLMKNRLPDIVLTDIMMPEMDGFTLLDKIRNDPGLEKIHVVAYSAAVMKEQKTKIRERDFAGLLVKPVRLSDLYKMLMRLIKYSRLDVKKKNDEDEKIPDLSGIVDLNILLESLEEELNTWNEFNVTQPLGKVAEFGFKLAGLGSKHKSKYLEKYGNDLVEATESFNIEHMLYLLRKYPGIPDLFKNQR
ncbi:MAG: PAS domain S-box protein [Bacteroidales bacterium]